MPAYALQTATQLPQELDGLGLPLACAGLGSFESRLLFMMLAPLGVLLLTKLISWVRRDRSHERLLLEQSRKLEASGESSTGRSRQRTMLRAALTQSSYKALPIWLRVTFVAFPSVSSLAFKAFRCDDLDDNDHLDGDLFTSMLDCRTVGRCESRRVFVQAGRSHARVLFSLTALL